ncbi:MAG: hypothetical protein H6737_17695 [Alphaproteobacteria bacterium]|nr:hypothetical protein [Alphaproteobacteria bacterium]
MLALVIGFAFAALPVSNEVCNGDDDDLDGIIDEGAACSPCTQINNASGSSWLVCDTAFATRAAALSYCQSEGYRIADIGSASEQSFLEGYLSAGVDYWHSVNDQATEGTYVNSYGNAVSYTNWDALYPNPQPDGPLYPSDDCALIYGGASSFGLWHDSDCAVAGPGVICEASCNPITVWEDSDGDGYGVGSPVTICGPAPTGTTTSNGNDCDDTRSWIHPGHVEVCNGFDDDCDGVNNELWTDGDGDGQLACRGDCDDADPTVYSGATETCDNRDEDCDGVVDEGLDGDGDGFTTCNGDCDDADPDRWPGAAEVLDAVDDDCDGIATDGPSYYQDRDGDGFGDPATETLVAGPTLVTVAGDCDDRSSLRHPGATETCNGVDDDCTGWADEGTVCGSSCVPFDGVGGERYLRCTDNEPYMIARDECRLRGWQLANPTTPAAEDDLLRIVGATSDRDWWHGANDIGEEGVMVGFDGASSSVSWTTGQPNDQDEGQDCVVLDPRPYFETHDRQCKDSASYVCETCAETAWFFDLDGDGMGAGDPVYACERPDAGLVPFGGDCDDGDPAAWKGAAEICDGIDNDCDGSVDEGPALQLVDPDNDGYGAASTGTLVDTCAGPNIPAGDCQPADPAVSAGATEVCNGIDDDCDGDVDEEGCICDVVQMGTTMLQVCDLSGTDPQWADARMACQSVGYDLALLNTPERHRNVILEAYARSTTSWFVGFQDPGTGWEHVDGTPFTYTRWANDQPSGNGVCGHIFADGAWTRWNDFQCANREDYLCTRQCTPTVLYRDADGDGEGDANTFTTACGPSRGWVVSSSDCDDDDPRVASRFAEACDGLDNDCNGVVDDNLPLTDWYADLDADGYGGTVVQGCLQPPDTVTTGDDCDDGNALVFPGAPESCDGTDEDCDGVIDNDALDLQTGFLDADGDGYGDDATAGAWCLSSLPTDYAALGGDCDDTDSTVSPGLPEICGPTDDNCDGLVDDEDPTLDPGSVPTWFTDADGDGHGDPFGPTLAECEQPSGFASIDDDCDDATAATYPGALDIPGDGIDQNCDGVDTPSDADSDGDGLLDVEEIALGSNPYAEDSDGDGVRDPDEVSPGPVNRDTDGDTVPDILDDDDDGDGVPTSEELTTDTDGDGLADYLDPDSDGDGSLDGAEGDGDSDGDGVIDRLDPGGGVVEAPPEATFGCGCRTGGSTAGLWLLVLAPLLRRR